MRISGNPIVQRALDLQATKPLETSLAIVDEAMRGFQHTSPDFESVGTDWSDWLDPPSPFAQLLHRAFGMHLPDSDVTTESPRWQSDVIEAFGRRYHLWPH